MIFRQIKISQVKCNFCMEWMSLATQIRFNINVCDNCLAEGYEEGNLRAVSSKGQLYQLYMVKQNSVIESINREITTESWFNDLDEDKNETDEQSIEKIEFLEQIDQYRNTEIKDIVKKWNMLTSFLKQKQMLSIQQISQLKKICSQNSNHISKLHQQFAISISSPQSNQPLFKQFKIQDQNTFLQQIKVNSSMEKRNQFTLQNDQNFNPFAITITNIQDIQLQAQQIKFQNSSQQKIKISDQNYNSPVKNALKQRDLNICNTNQCKIQNLKQNNEKFQKNQHYLYLDDQCSLNSSSVKSSFILNQSSTRSFRSNTIFNSMTKRSNKQEIKKIQLTKNKIVKYLEKNYESDSLIRLMFNVVFEAHQNTSLVGRSLQLISYNLSFIDFKCYLESFDWSGIETLKLVKTKLTDDQFKILLDFIVNNKLEIQILVLTGNKLSQVSVQYLYDNQTDLFKQIYLGKNRIMKGKLRQKICALRNKYSLYL